MPKKTQTLEERFRSDMLFYEALSKDTDRFPQFGTRYDLEKVYDRLKDIVDQFNFVDDVRNELNAGRPSVNPRCHGDVTQRLRSKSNCISSCLTLPEADVSSRHVPSI